MEYQLKPREREYLDSLVAQQKQLQADFEKLNVARVSALNLILKQNEMEGEYRLSEDGSKLVPSKPEQPKSEEPSGPQPVEKEKKG